MKSTSTNLATFSAELTDTFGGEANYSWVQRSTFQLPANAENRDIIKAAKTALGLQSACRVRPMFYGDSIELRFPRGACLVAFISVSY
jgi:hypothetical protein